VDLLGLLETLAKLVRKKKKPKSRRKILRKKKRRIRRRAKGKVLEVKKRPRKVSLEKTRELIQEWQIQIERVQDHPLSQVRVINTQLLEQLTDVLKSMNMKLDSLEKLNQILEILKKEMAEERPRVSEGLTLKDREAFKILKEKGPLSARELAKELKISRSTASSRLNRLYAFGVASKEAREREIIFRAK
jgi:uncharacterized membrane protein